MKRRRVRAIGIWWLLFVLSAFAQAPVSERTPTNSTSPLSIAGYLSSSSMPSSVALVPAPPVSGSAAMQRDEEINRRAVAMNGSPRWALAARDAVLSVPALARTFSCALSLPISEEKTPKVFQLMRRTMADGARSTMDAKERYKRERPFASNKKATCTPEQENVLRMNGSYPSGHAAIGFALGLVLSEASPAQTDALVARGRVFGQSRVICNVHWQSDVDEGQLVASALVARLNAEPDFQKDLAGARSEIEALRATSTKPDAAVCESETHALESWK